MFCLSWGLFVSFEISFQIPLRNRPTVCGERGRISNESRFSRINVKRRLHYAVLASGLLRIMRMALFII